MFLRSIKLPPAISSWVNLEKWSRCSPCTEKSFEVFSIKDLLVRRKHGCRRLPWSIPMVSLEPDHLRTDSKKRSSFQKKSCSVNKTESLCDFSRASSTHLSRQASPVSADSTKIQSLWALARKEIKSGDPCR